MGKLPREIVEHPTYTSVLGTVSGQYEASLTFPECFFRIFLTWVLLTYPEWAYDSIHYFRIPGQKFPPFAFFND